MKFIIPILLIIIPTIWFVFGEWAWLLVGLFVDVVVGSLSMKIVKPNTVRTVEFLWKFNRVLRPWFHFVIPFVERTKLQYLYKRNFSVKVEWVTSDNVTSYIGLNVISFVQDDWDDTTDGNIYKSIYSIDDSTTMMKATIDEQLRWMIVQFDHKEIFGKRQEIGEEIEQNLRVKLKSFGFTLDSIQVRDVSLDTSVMEAMNKVVESLKLKEAAYNEADAEKIKKVKSAEADREAKTLIWEGMALQREAIAKWFKESIHKIKESDPELNGRVVLDFLLASARIETLEKIWTDWNAKVIYVNENLEGKTASMIQWE